MKKIASLLLILSALLVSCEKENWMSYEAQGSQVKLQVVDTTFMFIQSTKSKALGGDIIECLNNNQHHYLVKTSYHPVEGEYVSKIYRAQGEKGISIFLPSIAVRPKPSVNINAVIGLISDYVAAARPVEWSNEFTYLDLNVKTSDEVLKTNYKLLHSGLVEETSIHAYMTVELMNTYYYNQWYLKNTGQMGCTNGIDINVEPAWDIVSGNSSITVAVIDDGVFKTHQDLSGVVLSGRTADYPEGDGSPMNDYILLHKRHGTNVAGIIAANDNSIGIKGVASGVKILPINIFPHTNTTNQGIADLDSIAEVIRWAAHRADVINLSWNHPYCASIKNAIDTALIVGRGGRGCVVVAAAGNDYPNTTGVGFPADIDGVISVGAIDKTGTICSYSQRGNKLDLVAPSSTNSTGGDIITTDGGSNSYCTDFGGTSAAAPMVAGTAALMLSANPTLTSASVRSILQNTAKKLNGETDFSTTYGYGLVDAGAAVEEAYNALFANDFKISGPAMFNDSADYHINNLPPEFTVNWWGGGVFGVHPYSDWCRLTQAGSAIPRGILYAYIYFGDQLIKTLSKTIYMSLQGSYSQASCPYYMVTHPAIPTTSLTSETAHFIHQGCLVTVNSPCFEGMTLYKQNVIPENWYFDGINTIVFSLPLGSGGVPFYIRGKGNPYSSAYDFSILFFSVSNNGNIANYNVVIQPQGDGFNITLGDNDDLRETLQMAGIERNTSTYHAQPLDVSVYSALNGNIMLSSRITENNFHFSTTGWPSGNYVIRIVVDDDCVLTEQVQVVY